MYHWPESWDLDWQHPPKLGYYGEIYRCIVYHLLPDEWVIDDLQRNRVKLSTFDDMNDPFELFACRGMTREQTNVFMQFRRVTGQIFPVLCCSANWKNPVLWSHYADKHRGCAFGFEVYTSDCVPITYVKDRFDVEFAALLQNTPETIATYKRLVTTKYEAWRYENEMRVGCDPAMLGPPRGPHRFRHFYNNLPLREVIVGSRSRLTAQDIAAAINIRGAAVHIRSASLALDRFEIVENPDIPTVVVNRVD